MAQLEFAMGLKDFEIDESGMITQYTGSKREVVIPETVDGIPVRFIGDDAFYGRFLQSVVLPEGLLHIGRRAFNLNNFERVEFPNSLVSIGALAFGENYLREIVMQNNLAYIGAAAFWSNYFTSVKLPDSVVYIGKGAFTRNDITYISFGRGLTTIQNGAFFHNNVKIVDIPAYVEVGNAVIEQDFDLDYSNHKRKEGRYVYLGHFWEWAGSVDPQTAEGDGSDFVI